MGAAALALGTLTVLAGCGGDDSPEVASADDAAAVATTSTTATVSAADREEALLAFARCMREEGVDFPDPEPDENGNLRPRLPRAAAVAGDRAAFQGAMEACSEFLEAARPELTDEQRQERQDQLLEFARCMREEGVEDFPDPSGEPGPGAFRGAINLGDPQTEEALETCTDRTGGFGPPGGGRAGGGGS